LKRVGNVVNIAIDPITGAILGPTTAPPTCPKKNDTSNNDALPSNDSGSGEDNTILPPPIEPSSGANNSFDIIPLTPVEPIVIQDGGVLVCSIQENICTGEIKRTVSQKMCCPTTDSDVPGRIQNLCWNDGTPTWYPRQRYYMNNSTDKWPVNATLLSSIKAYPPTITAVASSNGITTLLWEQPKKCLPVSTYIIYNNDTIVKTVNGNTFITNVSINSCIFNSFYIVGQSGTTISEKSNVVNVLNNTEYVITGNFEINHTNGNTFITFANTTTIGSIMFENNINVDIIAVGGGGGGGGGSNQGYGSTNLAAGGGGGGGGGGIQLITNYTLISNATYDIIVGAGGRGGLGNNSGSSGENTTFYTDASSIIANGVGGANGNGNYAGSLGGLGGSGTYSGANGGNGYNLSNNLTAQNGSNINPSMPINIRGQVFYFSGGGGGGTYSPAYTGGASGLNGIGGMSGSSSNGSNGQNATTMGAGGGGGSCPSIQFNESTGGNGATGCLIIAFLSTGC
jgi:hypothetical protein